MFSLQFKTYPDSWEQHCDVDVSVINGDERSDGAAIPDALDDGLDRLAGQPVDQLTRVFSVPNDLAHVRSSQLRRPDAFSGSLGCFLKKYNK